MFEVEHRDGSILRIATAATQYGYCPAPIPRTKITVIAIRCLLGLLAEGEYPCASRLAPFGRGFLCANRQLPAIYAGHQEADASYLRRILG